MQIRGAGLGVKDRDTTWRIVWEGLPGKCARPRMWAGWGFLASTRSFLKLWPGGGAGSLHPGTEAWVQLGECWMKAGQPLLDMFAVFAVPGAPGESETGRRLRGAYSSVCHGAGSLVGNPLWGRGAGLAWQVAPEEAGTLERGIGGCSRLSLPGLTPPLRGPLSWLMTNSGLIPANWCCQVFGFELSPAWASMLGFLGTVGEWTLSQAMPGESRGPELCSAAAPATAVNQ